MTLSKEELADKYADSQNLHMIGDWRKTDSSEYSKDRRGFLSGFTAAESRYKEALEIFDNRRKLAHSLRVESPQVAAFVEAIGVEMDKALAGKLREG